jgi:hypothetical protein
MELADLYSSLVSHKDQKQIRNDVKRGKLHPLLSCPTVQKQITKLLFMLCACHSYIQGLDAICFIVWRQSNDLGLLTTIYSTYIKPFVNREGHLQFKYPALVMRRLCAYYLPQLQSHFEFI